MPQHIESWSIPGSDNQPIIGNVHLPEGEPRGVIIIAHGFKGYKDYGMFPRIAARCAESGYVAHRFNFSHSGMTENIGTFEKPELFERDTFNRQVSDLRAVIEAVDSGEMAGEGLPQVLFGHSRGGVTVLLTAGRFVDDAGFVQPAGVVTASAPDRANPFDESEREQLLKRGYLDSPSSRTGQALRIGRDFLREQQQDPLNHDVPAMAAKIRCPMLVMHGEDDPTVPASAADRIVQAAGDNAAMLLIPGADHVFNTPNPLPEDHEASPQLQATLQALVDFANAATRP